MFRMISIVAAVLASFAVLPRAVADVVCHPGGASHSEHANGEKLYCIDSKLAGEDSYCLRSYPHDAKHVRLIQSGKSLRTDFPQAGSAAVDMFVKPTKPDVCASDPTIFMNVGNIMRISKGAGGRLKLQVFESNGKTPKEPYFHEPVVLSPGPKHGRFYWYGTAADPEPDQGKRKPALDLFVMLSDDAKGNMGTAAPADVPRIEQYFLVEAFLHDLGPNPGPDKLACEAYRPDFPDRIGLSNFRPWTTGDKSCDNPTRLSENGSGGGGHTWP